MFAKDIKEALESHGGIKGIVPCVVEFVSPSEPVCVPRITGISFLHNFRFMDIGVNVWKAYEVGDGKLLRCDILDKNG